MASLIRRLYHTARFILHIFRDLAGTLRDSIRRHQARCRGESFPLTIAWDIFPFYENLTGVGWYAYHLLRNLSQRSDVRINLYGHMFRMEEEGDGLFVDIDLPGVRFRTHGIPSRLILPRSVILLICKAVFEPLFQILDQNDVLFAPNFFPPSRMERAAPDMVPTIHDLTFKVFPEFVQNETLHLLESRMPSSIYHASRIIAVSESTRNDIASYFPGAESKTIKVLSGLDAPCSSGGSLEQSPYLLFVSTIEPRKNLDSLLNAFSLVKQQGYPGKLVIAGKVGWKSEETLSKMRAHPYAGSIRHLNYVNRTRLGDLYHNADLFVFPSHYEGFGFPLLEAMANGCPVIAARNSSLTEVGGDACAYVDSPTPEALAKVIMDVWTHKPLQEQYRKAGRKQAALFKWEEAARETLSVLESSCEDCR